MHASEAKDAGLINRLVPEVDLEDATKALAEVIAAKLASAIKIGKTAYYQQIQMPLDQAYAYTGDVMVQNMLNLDTKEGIAAFMEKRDPKWSQD
jgi:enoyl-CoA hydratase/carnithine racemase